MKDATWNCKPSHHGSQSHLIQTMPEPYNKTEHDNGCLSTWHRHMDFISKGGQFLSLPPLSLQLYQQPTALDVNWIIVLQHRRRSATHLRFIFSMFKSLSKQLTCHDTIKASSSNEATTIFIKFRSSPLSTTKTLTRYLRRPVLFLPMFLWQELRIHEQYL